MSDFEPFRNESNTNCLTLGRASASVVGLDVGGVLILSPWELLVRRYPSHGGILELLGPYSQGTDKTYDAMIAGTISEAEYWQQFSTAIQRLVPTFAASDNPVRDLILCSQSPTRGSLLNWIREFVGVGGLVLTFSNGLFKNLGKRWWADNIPQSLIHKHYDASETGIRKPDVRVFGPLIDYGRDPSTCRVLYVDDNPHYAAAATSIGIPSLWFSAADSEVSLRKMSSFYQE